VRLIIAMLVTLFGLLQYELWFADGGLLTVYHLHQDVQVQQLLNEKLIKRNREMMADVEHLKHSKEAVEAHARYDLGMVKQGEVFYQIVHPQ